MARNTLVMSSPVEQGGSSPATGGRKSAANKQPPQFPWLPVGLVVGVMAGTWYWYTHMYQIRRMVAVLGNGIAALAVILAVTLVWRYRGVVAVLATVLVALVGGLWYLAPQCRPDGGLGLPVAATCLYQSIRSGALAPLAAQQDVPLSQVSASSGAEDMSAVELLRFDTCVDRLYKSPALRFMADLQAEHPFSADLALELALTSLVVVCERYTQEDMTDLSGYYHKVLTQHVIDAEKGGGSYAACLSEDLAAVRSGQCLDHDGQLDRTEAKLLARGVCALSERQLLVLHRWSRGGTWEEIGEEWEMNPNDVRNEMRGVVVNIQEFFDRSSCRIPDRVP